MCPSCALASAIRSFVLLAGTDAFTTSIGVPRHNTMIGVKSFALYGSLWRDAGWR